MVLILCIFAALLAALEVGARYITGSRKNPELYRLVQDYERLLDQGADWIRFVPDETLGYRLRPGFVLPASRGSGRTVHNDDGFRDDANFGPKLPGTLRICCFGASTTYGVGVEDNGDTYPAQLELILEQAARERGWERIEVLNLGVGGYNSREILGTMARMLPTLQPDVVLIQNAINDVIPRFYPESKPDYSHYRTPFSPIDLRGWQRLACRSHGWLILSHRLGWIRPLSLQSQTQRPMPPVTEALKNLELNSPEPFESNLREAITLAQQGEAEVWLLTQPYLDIPAFAAPGEDSRRLDGGYRRGLEEHTEIVERLSEETGTGLLQLHVSMPRKPAYFTDPIHMSKAGNEIKASLIAEALRDKLPAPSR